MEKNKVRISWADATEITDENYSSSEDEDVDAENDDIEDFPVTHLTGVVVAVSANILTSFGTILRSSPSWEKALRKSSPLYKIIIELQHNMMPWG